MFVCAISRPRKRTVTFSRSPSARNFCPFAQLDKEVVLADAGGHPYLLDLHDALVLARFLLPLGLLEAVLAVVHYLADGGSGARRDFYEVEVLLHGDVQSGCRGHDPKLLAVFADQAHLTVADFFVDLYSVTAIKNTSN